MILQLIFSVLLGALIGLEMEYRGKPVGLRTIALITLGSTLFVLMSPNIFNGDNSRIIAQVVSGIGFLGAGVLIKNGHTVNGLTTAATIWGSSAIGCLIGANYNLEAFIGTILIIIINRLSIYLKNGNQKIRKNRRS